MAWGAVTKAASARSRVKTKRKMPAKAKPVSAPSTYIVEPLDPWLKCGPDTTVTELWKVRERRERETHFHLVYLDRYGWYCEHGRDCAAVTEVRRVVREMTEDRARSRAVTKARPKKRR